MQPLVKYGRSDDQIPEDRTPFAVAPVRCQDDAAAFVACTDELEEDGGAEIVQRQIAISSIMSTLD
jgi:hypothetical protein